MSTNKVTTKKEEQSTQLITITGKLGKLTKRFFGNDNRMVGRGKLEYFTKSAVNDDKEHNSRIELEFWDDLGAKATDDKIEGAMVTVTGELFQRRWIEEGTNQLRTMHRINVHSYKLVSKGSAPKAEGKYSKYATASK